MGINKPIVGTSSADELKSSKKGVNYLAGLQGNDKYIIEKLSNNWTMVDDTAQIGKLFDYYDIDIPSVSNGGDDTLQINGFNANDLLLFLDVGIKNSSNQIQSQIDDGLYITSKSYVNSFVSQTKNAMEKGKLPSGKVVEIDYFFGDDNNYQSNGEYGDNPGSNRIETIQTFKNGVTKVINVDKYIEDVRSKVIEVLDKYGYSTASELMFSCSTKSKAFKELLECYKTPMDLEITGSDKNDKIYAEAGSDTIIFDESSGNDIVYNTTSADKLEFKGMDDFAQGGYCLIKNGNNLYIYYSDEYDEYGNFIKEYNVTLSNYYKQKPEDRLDEFSVNDKKYSIKEMTVIVEGKGKIYGTEYNDIVDGSSKSDKIYGNGGNDELLGDWGNDIIYSQSQAGTTVLLAGEEGNDKLYAGEGKDIFNFGEAIEKGEGKDVIYNANSKDKLQFCNVSMEDLKFTKSGNNLVVTIKDVLNSDNENVKAAYKNFQATLSNYFKTEDKLDDIEFITYEEFEKTTSSKISDATIYVSGSKKIEGTDFNDIITGSKSSDKITTLKGTDEIIGAKGNDTITLGEGKKTLYFANGDGKDSVIISDDTSSVDLKFTDIKEGDNLSFSKEGNALVITHSYKNGKGVLKSGGTVTIKDYFDEEGNIKYNNVSFTEGEDEAGKDLKTSVKEGLTIEGIYNKKIKETEFIGSEGKDIMTYQKSGMGAMFGGYGDDTYNTTLNKKTNLYVCDVYENTSIGGGEDTLNISASKDDIALLFNVDSHGMIIEQDSSLGYDEDGTDSLFIFYKNSLTTKNLKNILKGKDSGGHIEIDAFFDESKSGNVFEKDKYGYIENINVQNGDGGFEKVDMEQWIQEIAGQVANWFTDHSGYSSTYDVLTHGNTADIESLLSVYQSGSYQKA